MKAYPICPHCNTVSAVFQKVQAHGKCERIFDRWGNQMEINTDDLWFTRTKRMYCLHCKKYRSDLIVVDGDAVVGIEEVE